MDQNRTAVLEMQINRTIEQLKKNQMDACYVSNKELALQKVKEWVDREYEEGRVTSITDKELVEAVGRACDELGIQERPKR